MARGRRLKASKPEGKWLEKEGRSRRQQVGGVEGRQAKRVGRTR